MRAAKEAAPKARQRSGARVGNANSTTSAKIPPNHAAVNVLVGEVFTRDDGARIIPARAAEMDWTLARLTDNDEPRIRDIDLAERLGFERPRAIRQIIERHVSAGNISPIMRHTVERVIAGKGARHDRTINEYWLTIDEALFITTQSETKNAVRVTKVMIAVFAAVMRGETVSRDRLPPELGELITELRRELDAARTDASAYKAESVMLMRLIGASGKHRADQLKSIFNETAKLNSESQGRPYRSCRTEVESLVRDRIAYPRGASMTIEAMPMGTWELAKIYATQELARARRLSAIAKQPTIRFADAS